MHRFRQSGEELNGNASMSMTPPFLAILGLVIVLTFDLFCVSCFFRGGHGGRGWYDNPQPALRLLLAQCTTPCVCYGVCMYGWCMATVIPTVRV